MGQNILPTRHAPYTTETLRSDMTMQADILSRACGLVEHETLKLVQLAEKGGAQDPELGYHATRVDPAPLDKAALEPIRDQALRDAQRRIGALQDRIATLTRCRVEYTVEIGGQLRVITCTRGASHPHEHSNGAISWPATVTNPRR